MRRTLLKLSSRSEVPDSTSDFVYSPSTVLSQVGTLCPGATSPPLGFRFYLIEELGRYLGPVFNFLMCREMQDKDRKENEVKWINFTSKIFFCLGIHSFRP